MQVCVLGGGWLSFSRLQRCRATTAVEVQQMVLTYVFQKFPAPYLFVLLM